MAFSRNTQLAACNLLQFLSHSQIDSLMLRLGVDQLSQAEMDNKEKRLNKLFRFLQEHPKIMNDGRPIVRQVVEEAAKLFKNNDYLRKREDGAKFLHQLNADGFSVVNGELRAAFPETLDLPDADDEVHALLKKHSLKISLGHLHQALTAHARGEWAAANSQLRTFYEALFDEIAVALNSQNAGIATGETRRQLLANLAQPFIRRDLNEWSDDGKNYVNGIFKRLHPQGSHPGLSDEEDSTFRVHLVLLTARLFLRRLDATRKGNL